MKKSHEYFTINKKDMSINTKEDLDVVAKLKEKLANDRGDYITREDAIEELIKQQNNEDIEVAHSNADSILCRLLESLGYSDVVKEYYKVEKWYA